MGPQTILDTAGNKTLLELRHVVPSNGARIFLNLESENSTASIKDRITLAIISLA
jgi:cysteine synthase A